MTPLEACAYHDPSTAHLDAKRMAADGLASLCLAESLGRDEFIEIVSLLEDPGPFQVAGAAFDEPFDAPIRVPTPELAYLRRSALVLQHRMIASESGWAIWEFEEGDVHVLFGEPARLRPAMPKILRRARDDWRLSLSEPKLRPHYRAELDRLRCVYTFNLGVGGVR
jgi:hypothetical protein